MATRPYDTAAYLETPEDITAYITEALESGDSAVIAYAIGVAARARGMTERRWPLEKKPYPLPWCGPGG